MAKFEGNKTGMMWAMMIALAMIVPAAVAVVTDDQTGSVRVNALVENGNQRVKSLIQSYVTEEYSAFSLCEMPQSELDRLVDLGVSASPMNDLTTIMVGKYTFDTTKGEPSIPAELRVGAQAPGEVGLYLVQLKGPVKDEWVKGLDYVGAEVITYVPNNAYEVLMTPEEASTVQALGYVRWIGAYQPAYKLSTGINDLKVTVTFIGSFIPKTAIETTLNQMSTVMSHGTTAQGYIIEGVLKSQDGFSAIAAIPWVHNIAQWYPNELHDEAGSQIIWGYLWYNDPDNNVATPYRGLGTHGAYVNQLGWDGTNVKVAIADTGLGTGVAGNAGHNDFTGRVMGGMTYSGTSWADGHGHGTHCAGLIVADSFGGNGLTYSGYGPYYLAEGLGHDARIYAQKIFSDAGGWIGPADYGQILLDGYTGGGRLHSNSWGSATGGAYSAHDQAYDTRARDSSTTLAGNQPMIITVSAGNSGSGTNTIGSPGNSKNVITVGSYQNYMPDSTSRGNTDTTGAGSNPDTVSTWSSRGWCDDNRIKPDIVAPGEWTLSTHSAQIPGTSNLYGLYTGDNRYEWCSGTSQANPTANGGVAAIYEYYNVTYGAPPSPAMAKALVINTAVDVGAADIPNQNEGWGRMYLPTVVNPPAKFIVKDNQDELTTGTYKEFKFSYDKNTQPVKVTLAYTDKNALSGAAVALINNLDLRITSPTGGVFHGNAFTAGVTPVGANPAAVFDTNADGWDDRNNVECVYIPPAQLQAGQYTIRITGFNVGGDADNDGTNDQDYSLVIYNARDVSSQGTIDIQYSKYPRESTVQVTVGDTDLNNNPTTIQTTSINIRSVAEPAGESMTLTETGANTSVFSGTITISATNSAGVLWVNAADTLTATYNDANNGTGPATVTDTAIVDGTPPAPPTGLTVTWTGTTTTTLAFENFTSATYPPTGWQVLANGTTGTWSRQLTANAGGTSPESRFYYGATGQGVSRLICGPLVTTGMTTLNMTWNGFYDGYGTGVTVRVQTATAAAGPWTNTNWVWIGTAANKGPMVEGTTLTTAHNVGSATLYVAFAVIGDSYQLDYWYQDNVFIGYSAPNTNDNRLNWVKSTDDGAGANDVIRYNVYRANNAAGPWNAGAYIANVSKGIQTFTDPGRGQIDGINWWYVVRAVDDAGNMDTNTNAVPEVMPSAAWANLTVALGWNLVSIPLVGSGTMPGVLTDKVGGVVWTRAMWCNPMGGSDKWRQYNSGWNAALNDLTLVNNSMGVWLFVTTLGDGQICVGGAGYSTPTTTAVPLRAGWNLVGFPSDDTTYTVAMLKAACPSVTMVEQFDGGQTYLTSAMADAATFAQGRAYWIYTSADATWNKAW